MIYRVCQDLYEPKQTNKQKQEKRKAKYKTKLRLMSQKLEIQEEPEFKKRK